MQHIKDFLVNLSHHPGVYQMLGEKGEVLYVGKAKDLKKRISSYFSRQAKDPKTQLLLKFIANIDITITHSENEAVLLECNLIKKHRPRFNVLLRDDKSYPYILITSKHSYPRIDVYRGPRRKNALYFGPYTNAHAVRETISLLQKIFKIRTCRDPYFDSRTRPCLLHQIDRCTAPCVNLISKEDYAIQVNLAILFLMGKSDQVIKTLQDKMELSAKDLNYEAAVLYREQITRLRQIQDKQYVNVKAANADVIGFASQAGIVCIQLLTLREGQVLGSRSYYPSVPLNVDKQETIAAFIKQHYLNHPTHIETIPKEIVVDVTLDDKVLIEEVFADQAKHKVSLIKPAFGEKKKWIAIANNTAKQALSTQLYRRMNIEGRAQALQVILDLPNIPNRIECYDISHSHGEATVASCVVFDRTGPIKSDYRRFNIEEVTAGDDIAAMRQVLTRRFKRLQKESGSIPDVVLIDGGQTQLQAANDVLKLLDVHDVMLVGVSKGPGRKAGFELLHFVDKPSIHLEADSLALHFIQQIRDEAHRFAITGHRQQRDKIRRQSTLEKIPGVGAKRRRELLRYFGGIQGVHHASLDELTKVPGISRPLAERIFAAFHDTTI